LISDSSAPLFFLTLQRRQVDRVLLVRRIAHDYVRCTTNIFVGRVGGIGGRPATQSS
jgi:hypothetical protein